MVCRYTGNKSVQTAATFQLGHLKIQEAIGRHIEAAQTSSFKTLKLRRRMLQVAYFFTPLKIDRGCRKQVESPHLWPKKHANLVASDVIPS